MARSREWSGRRHQRRAVLHPGAWWLWALGLGTAASRTTNPLLLALLIAASGYVVAARRTGTPPAHVLLRLRQARPGRARSSGWSSPWSSAPPSPART